MFMSLHYVDDWQKTNRAGQPLVLRQLLMSDSTEEAQLCLETIKLNPDHVEARLTVRRFLGQQSQPAES